MKNFQRNLFLGIIVAAASVTGYILNEKDRESYVLEMRSSAEQSQAVRTSEEAIIPDIGTGADDDAAKTSASDKINLNTADAEALDTLPGIGPVKAERIIEYRQTNGAFEVIEDIMNVDGIGRKTFENLKDYITV